MTLDLQALLDPAKIREADRERERQETEQAERDARMAASLAALGHASDALRLTNAEGRFVRQVTAIWKRTGYLTGAQTTDVREALMRKSQRSDGNSIDQKAARAERDQVQASATARFIFGPVPEPALPTESLRQDYQRQRGGA